MAEDMKQALVGLLDDLSKDGRGPFEKWSAERAAARRSVTDLSDRALSTELANSYGGHEIVAFLESAGLRQLLVRDLSSVVGPVRANSVLALPPEITATPARSASDARPAKPTKPPAPPKAKADLSWLWMVLGGVVLLAVVGVVVVVFASLIVRIIASAIAIGSLVLLYRPRMKSVAFAGLAVWILLNGVANDLAKPSHPAPVPKAAAAPA